MKGNPMLNVSLKKQVEIADERAESLIKEMKDSSLTETQFSELVKEYLLCKFLLDSQEYTTDNILELAEISIEKLLMSNDKSIKLAQGSNTCTNQSSTDVKKVLLSLILQRSLAIKLTPQESAKLETVPELAHTLFVRLHDTSSKAVS